MGVTQHVVNRGLGLGGGYTRVSTLYTKPSCTAYIISIMWNSISGLDTWYHFQFNISCGVAVKVRSHQEKFQVIFSWGGEGDKIKIWRDGPIFKGVFVFRSSSFLMSFSFLRLS